MILMMEDVNGDNGDDDNEENRLLRTNICFIFMNR